MTSGDLVVEVERHGTAVRNAYGITLAWCPMVTAASANGISAAQAEANARLFAAAQDLQCSLEDVMTWIDNWTPPFTDDPHWAQSRDRARAALAKATGKEVSDAR